MKKAGKAIMVVLMIPIIAVCAYAGDIEPPSGSPSSTMKTLDEIPPSWHQILSASERFKDVMGEEAVLDKETGLVWARTANLGGEKSYIEAINYCRNLIIGNRKGWRLPTVEELSSLLDMSIAATPKVPSGVFENLQSTAYWSCSDSEDIPGSPWIVYMGNGDVGLGDRGLDLFIWPVRGGND